MTRESADKLTKAADKPSWSLLRCPILLGIDFEGSASTVLTSFDKISGENGSAKASISKSFSIYSNEDQQEISPPINCCKFILKIKNQPCPGSSCRTPGGTVTAAAGSVSHWQHPGLECS